MRSTALAFVLVFFVFVSCGQPQLPAEPQPDYAYWAVRIADIADFPVAADDLRGLRSEDLAELYDATLYAPAHGEGFRFTAETSDVLGGGKLHSCAYALWGRMLNLCVYSVDGRIFALTTAHAHQKGSDAMLFVPDTYPLPSGFLKKSTIRKKQWQIGDRTFVVLKRAEEVASLDELAEKIGASPEKLAALGIAEDERLATDW